MKLPDVNIWFALMVDTHEHHRAALAWMDHQDSASGILFCRATMQGFLRLATTATIMKGYGYPPFRNDQAWERYGEFLADDRISFAHEPPGLEESWKALALRKTASPKLWMDAYLAAFAIRSGYQLISADKAFSQFKGLDFHLIGDA
jgi:uncharacterized protein